jgi:hypothetical protein
MSKVPMLTHRRPTRLISHGPNRRLTRPAFRQRWRAPDDLGEALGAFRRALGSYRRLARLAPHHFDTTVIERERRERAERRAWMATWEPALEKAYGPPTAAEREARRLADLRAELPPPLAPRTEQAVAREFARYTMWQTLGKAAFARYQQRRPHGDMSLGRIARLLEIAMDLKWIATGVDWRKPEPPSAPLYPSSNWEADLRRAYGPDVPATPAPSAPPAKPALAPEDPPPPPPPSLSPPPAPAAAPVPRCDAWRRWARQQRSWRNST